MLCSVSADKKSNEFGAHLYVMQSTSGAVKIGRSGNPRKRRDNLQAASGDTISILRIFRGRGSDELAAHAACAAYRKRGEWFRDCQDFREALCAFLGVEITFRNGERERAERARSYTDCAIEKYFAQRKADKAMRRASSYGPRRLRSR